MAVGVTTAGNIWGGNPKKNGKNGKPQGADGSTPWWAATMNPQQGMQIFAPGVDAAISEAAKRTPQGLSQQDMANMKSRVASQNMTATRTGLTNMAGAMGGAGSPAFAMQAARLQAGAGNAASAKMADVNIDEVRNNQSIQMARRGQMIDAAKLGIGYGGIASNFWQGMGQQDAANAAVQLERDKWSEWVNRRRAQNSSGGMEAGKPVYSPTAGIFQEQYGGR